MRNWQEFKCRLRDNQLTELGIENSEDSIIMVDLNHVLAFYKTTCNKTDDDVTSILIGNEWHDLLIEYDEFKLLMFVNAPSL